MRTNATQSTTRTEQLLRIPTGRRRSSWLFTSAAETLNQEQVQQVVRAGLQPVISGSQGTRPDQCAALPLRVVMPGTAVGGCHT